ncbi:MAG TPA: hypothetical protein VK075_06385 [Pseudogracilibacillus sp.]|nr:hypothetical protein [Pseudogracilibacillus sp.]
MKYVIAKSTKSDHEEKMNVLRLEIDYELVNLQDALDANDEATISQAKNKLRRLVYELNTLKHYIYE